MSDSDRLVEVLATGKLGDHERGQIGAGNLVSFLAAHRLASSILPVLFR